MQLPTKIRFFTKELEQTVYALEFGDGQERALYAHIRAALEQIRKDAFCGVQIQKRLIPKEYKYLRNLWKYNLPDGWRLLYSIRSEEIDIVSIIIEWLDHKNYEKRFQY